MQTINVGLAAATLDLAVAAPHAWSQDTKSLGGGTGTGKIMTREELRACLKRQDDLAAMVAKFEADRSAHEKEKGALLEAQQNLKGDRGDVQAAQGKVREINERSDKLSAAIADWNARMQAFEKENRSGPFADRERRRLMQEKRDLEDESAALEKARAEVGGGEAQAEARAYNERAEALQARTVAWNKRNQELADRSVKLTDERQFWAAECGSRRFTEQDEMAIRQGK